VGKAKCDLPLPSDTAPLCLKVRWFGRRARVWFNHAVIVAALVGLGFVAVGSLLVAFRESRGEMFLVAGGACALLWVGAQYELTDMNAQR